MNKELRKKIVAMVYKGKDGHIPSAFSITNELSRRHTFPDTQRTDALKNQYR